MKWRCPMWAMFAVASAATASPVTFSHDIAPLVWKHCAPCHHDGGVGPFPLLTYEQVSKHAMQIASVTARRYMPPWPPEHGANAFKGDRSLTNDQIRLIADWVKDGKAPGDLSQLPAPPQYTTNWQMGKPDLVLRMPQAFHLPATGSDVFRNFIVPSGLKETRYVRGLELHLSNPRVVHHANVILDRTRSLRKRDGEDGRPGFPGMDIITEASAASFDPDSHFLFWKPATVLALEPEDMSWKLDPGTDLVLNLHLQPTGKEEEVQAEIGLYFSPKPPTRFPMLLQLEHDGAIHIPPGSRTFSVTDSLTLPVDVDLLAIYPHAHYLGKVIEAWATLPDGARQSLIRVPDWDINWQAEYEYQRPVFLPKGTKVSMRITYDNSIDNPRNPNRPPKLVETGDRSEDEMGHVWLQVLPRSQGRGEDPRLDLQEAVMKRRLEKYPADFVAHYNLGALEQSRGKLDDALSNYQTALQVDPKSTTARNSMASVLMMEDRLPEAIEEFRTVLRNDPGYSNARYNLAHALAAQGQLDDAAQEYEEFLRQQPNDAEAEAALGTVYFKQQRIPKALKYFRAAARLSPGDADVQANLGALLAMSGDLHGAEQAFEQALRVNPNHAAASANLNRVRAQLAARQQ